MRINSAGQAKWSILIQSTLFIYVEMAALQKIMYSACLRHQPTGKDIFPPLVYLLLGVKLAISVKQMSPMDEN
jgi:hypothetical protein